MGGVEEPRRAAERDEGTEDVKYTGLSIHLFAGCFGKRYGSGDADATCRRIHLFDNNQQVYSSQLYLLPTLSVFINLFHPKWSKHKKTQPYARAKGTELPACLAVHPSHRIGRNACYSAVRKWERPVIGPLAGGAK
ncbi:hypothetical protein ALC53_04522 [Atta colombica]|uniref:Uncharacterized protein n=1 Tax=Atta colombica TaxID=520822 RepID=A0A195BLJ8_9HYME|nr:hypothetical protein ALC53_04522 [Atta colombica]